MPNPPKSTAPKATVKPSVHLNIVQSGKPMKTVSVKSDCCLSKGAKK